MREIYTNDKNKHVHEKYAGIKFNSTFTHIGLNKSIYYIYNFKKLNICSMVHFMTHLIDT